MNHIKCPYCEYEYELCTDDGHGCAEEQYEEQCPKCKKKFIFFTEIYFKYFAYKVDCLNSGEHKYSYQMSNDGVEYRICRECRKTEIVK